MNCFVIKPFKIGSRWPVADFKISFIIISMFEAVKDEAPHTEWGDKICVSIPASSKSLFNHLRNGAICYCPVCLIVAMKSFVISPRIRAVCVSYACSVSTGHNFLFSRNERKKSFTCMFFPSLDSFAEVAGGPSSITTSASVMLRRNPCSYLILPGSPTLSWLYKSDSILAEWVWYYRKFHFDQPRKHCVLPDSQAINSFMGWGIADQYGFSDLYWYLLRTKRPINLAPPLQVL